MRIEITPALRAKGIFSGTAFPPNPAEGDCFYRTDLDEFYIFDGTNWILPTPAAHAPTHVLGGIDEINTPLNALAIALANQGDIVFHAAAVNTLAALAPGVAGQALITGGPGADPFWAAPAPAPHAATHEPGGVDDVNDIDILNTGVLLSAHEARHVLGGADDIDAPLDARAIALANQGDIVFRAAAVNTLAALAPGVAGQSLVTGGPGANPFWAAPAPAAHAATHEPGGADEVNDIDILNTGLLLSTLSLSNMPAVPLGNINCGGQALTNVLSITIGANTLNTTEWAFLDGQDQAVKTTSNPTFNNLTLTGWAWIQGRNYLFATPADPAGMTGTVFKMMGLGSTLALTPQFSGVLKVEMSLSTSSTTINAVVAQLCYGTGAPPANGAAATGTAFGPQLLRANTLYPDLVDEMDASWVFVVTGLVVGTPYWFDVKIRQVPWDSGVPITIQKIMAYIEEI